MSVTGQEGRQSSEWSDTDEFTAVSDLFCRNKTWKKRKKESWKTKGGWEEEDEFTIDKLLFPWSYE